MNLATSTTPPLEDVLFLMIFEMYAFDSFFILTCCKSQEFHSLKVVSCNFRSKC